jgi:hypothetical protein
MMGDRSPANGDVTSKEWAHAITVDGPARWLAWVSIGLAAACAIVLWELSRLLQSIENSGGRSYSASVFTGPSLTPWSGPSEITEALRTWIDHFCWVALYLFIDMVFVLAYCVVLYLLMSLVGVQHRRPHNYARRFVLVLFGIGMVETVCTYVILKKKAESFYGVIPALYTAKWLILLIVTLVIVVCWLSPNVQGSASIQKTIRSSMDTLRRGEQGPAVALRGLLVLVGIFLALVALPAGGPLEQLPDVLRAEFSPLRPLRMAASIICLLLFVGSLMVAGWRSTSVPSKLTGKAPQTKIMIPVALLVGLAIAFVNFLYGSPGEWAGLAFPAVILGLVVADCLRTRMFMLSAQPSSARQKSGNQRARLHRQHVPNVPEPRDAAWIGGITGAAVVGSGIGLLRGSFRPLILTGSFEWWIGVGGAVVVTVVGGLFTQWLVVCRASDVAVNGPRRSIIVFAGYTCASLVIAAALVLAIFPTQARHVGTNGTIALCLGLAALIIGEIHRLARSRLPWGVTERLSLGARTPWLGIIVSTWLLACMLNIVGGYDDARLLPASAESTHRYTGVHDAWSHWLTAVTRPGCNPNNRIKMLLVAAPGGGIRASYWTAAGLEALAPPKDKCSRAGIFAISAVSGGSVGTATWLQAQPGSARETVAKLSEDRALAASAAALFLRDLPQPLLGLTDAWNDRAKVMEETWVSSAPEAFGTTKNLRPWSTAGEGQPWIPAVILNGSSVTDGCRVLITNVAMLPAAAPDCRTAPGSATTTEGPMTGSLDAVDDLAAGLGKDGANCTLGKTSSSDKIAGQPSELPVVTAALLSGRFPVVTPSGVLKRCLANQQVSTTYTVDGGYYENSGLLSLLQLWTAVAPLAESCTGCPQGTMVEPWIVLLDNHYRSLAARPSVPRQHELAIPLEAFALSSAAIDQTNLEQAAALAMHSFTGAGNSTGQFLRIGPANGPSVQAPLGWVLSDASRCDLDEQLSQALGSPDAQRLLSRRPDPVPAKCQ